MKKLSVLIALAGALLTPKVTLAATASAPNSSVNDRIESRQLEIVDPATGTIVGILLPVSASRDGLGVIGRVRSAVVEQPAAAAEPPLTPLQFATQHQRELDEQFHVEHTS